MSFCTTSIRLNYIFTSCIPSDRIFSALRAIYVHTYIHMKGNLVCLHRKAYFLSICTSFCESKIFLSVARIKSYYCDDLGRIHSGTVIEGNIRIRSRSTHIELVWSWELPREPAFVTVQNLTTHRCYILLNEIREFSSLLYRPKFRRM